jgi:hypothetical protein
MSNRISCLADVAIIRCYPSSKVSAICPLFLSMKCEVINEPDISKSLIYVSADAIKFDYKNESLVIF